MSVFNSILVGIDLLQANGHDSSRFSLPVEEAIKHALWLAERACASVTFFAALPEDTLHPPKADESRLASQLCQSGQRGSIILSSPPRSVVYPPMPS